MTKDEQGDAEVRARGRMARWSALYFPNRVLRDARREQYRMAKLGPRRRAVAQLRSIWRRLPAPVRALAAPVGTIGAAVIGLYVPVSWTIPALRESAYARTFLGLLWQVTAFAVGFSVAVVIFAFQAIASNRAGGSVREFARGSRLLLAVNVGVASLVVDGVVLLNVGHGSPSGWAATWATAVSALTLLLVAIVIGASVQAVEPKTLHRRRREGMARRALNVVEEDLLQRLVLGQLTRDANARGYGFSLWGPSRFVRTSGVALKAERSGVVRDIRLGQLRRLARDAQKQSREAPVLMTHPGRAVEPDTIILTLAADASARSRRAARRVVVLRKSPPAEESELEELASQLHEEALDAIRASRPAAYEYVRRTQEELLVSVPRAWARYGEEYTPELAEGMFPLSFGPVQLLAKSLYEQAVVAMQVGGRDIAFASAASPTSVAFRAADLGARGLSSRMLGVVRSLAAATAEYDRSHVGSIIHERLLEDVFRYVEYKLAPRIEDPAIELDQRFGATEFLHQALRVVADMLHEAIGRGDVDYVVHGCHEWDELMDHWLAENDPSYTWRDPSDLAVAGRILPVRRGLHFSVTAWAIRRLWDSPTDPDALQMATRLMAQYPSVPEVFTAAELAQGEDRISDWVMGEQFEGRRSTGSIDSLTPVLRAAALLTLRSICSSGSEHIPESLWLSDRADAFERAFEAAATNPSLLQSLGIKCPPSDLHRLALEELRDAVARHARNTKERVIASDVEPARVEEFTASVREGWAEERTAVRLVARGGLLHTMTTDPPGGSFALAPQVVPKDWFTNDRIYVRHVAEDIGRSVARGENDAYWDLVAKARPVRTTNASLRERVDSARSQMTANGYAADLLLIPTVWEVRESLAPYEAKPDDAPSRAVGVLEGLLVVESRGLADDRVVLVDSTRFVEIQQWVDESGQCLSVEVTPYTEETAAELIERNPDVVQCDPSAGVSDRVRELLAHVRLDVREKFELKAVDRGAARALRVLPPRKSAKSVSARRPGRKP